MYSPRVGRFFAVDPEAKKYSFQSPYAFATNNPVRLVDVNGLGVDKKEDDYYYNSTTGGTKVVKTNDKKDNLYVDGKLFMSDIRKGTLREGYTNKLWGMNEPISFTDFISYDKNTELGESNNVIISSYHYEKTENAISETTASIGLYKKENKKMDISFFKGNHMSENTNTGIGAGLDVSFASVSLHYEIPSNISDNMDIQASADLISVGGRIQFHLFGAKLSFYDTFGAGIGLKANGYKNDKGFGGSLGIGAVVSGSIGFDLKYDK